MNFSRVKFFAFFGLFLILALQVVSANGSKRDSTPTSTKTDGVKVVTTTVFVDEKGNKKKSCNKKHANAAYNVEPSVFALFMAGVGAVIALL